MKRNIFLIILLVLFMNCNKTNSKEKLEEIKNEKTVQTLKNNKSCKELESYNINIDKIELKNKGLEEIECISKYKNIKELDLRWNEIKDLKPLEELEKLEVLKINFNKIEDIRPILKLKKLKELWLHNNKIEDISGIKALSKLEHLDLSFNILQKGIEEIKELKNLKRLELRETPKKVVDYIYNNYQEFLELEKIFIEERIDESREKRENKIRYPNFSEFNNKINNFEAVKIIKEILPEEISIKEFPNEVYKIIEENEEKDTEEKVNIEEIEYYTNKNYSIYVITRPYSYTGKSNREVIFMKNNKVITIESGYIYAQLESIEGDNLFLSIISASGAENYIISDLKKEIVWRDEYRSYGLIPETSDRKNYRTGKIYKLKSKDDLINIRKEAYLESEILYKLKKDEEVEEIFEKNNLKYVYFYNKESGYYMKGYVEKKYLGN